nr:nero [Cucujiformia]
AIDVLVEVLEDLQQEPMVRHEAGEALGALGYPEAIDVLTKYKSDPTVEVAETCEIALDRIKWLSSSKDEENQITPSVYTSVDPAPPSLNKDVSQLESILTDEKATLFERYRAMFALRNLHTPESVAALGRALKCGSALFKHEIAFVLGQMQDVGSVRYLIESLKDTSENE